MMGTAFCYVYVYTFFQTWFHTFLVRGRGFSEGRPGALGAAVRRRGVREPGGRSHQRRAGPAPGREVGPAVARHRRTGRCVPVHHRGHGHAGSQLLTVVLLSLVYGAITFQQSGVFGVCLDIGRKHAGAMVGLMNTSAQVGGLVASVAYGYIVERFGSYDAPFVPMAGALVRRRAAVVQNRRLGRFERGAAGGRCRGASAVASVARVACRDSPVV